MLYFNFQKIFKLRGVGNGVAFFRRYGLTSYQARSVINFNRSDRFFRILEVACMALDCTPNDLIEWKPSKAEDDVKGAALQRIRASEVVDFSEMVKGVPIERLGEVRQALLEAVEKIKNSEIK